MISVMLVFIVWYAFPIFPVSAGEVTLSWDPATTNADGTPLTDLAGYKVYYGTSPGAYDLSLDVGNIPTPYTVVNLTENATYYFAVTAYNISGNESDFSNQVVKTLPEVTLPTGTLAINGGATTASTTVTLALSCSDAGSGCSRMQFSNDGTTWSVWETVATSKSWTLTPGDGTKTAYVRYQDNAANVSPAYAATVIMDTTTPVLSGIGTADVTNTQATIIWTTHEPATSEVAYGTSAALESASSKDSSLVTRHSVILTGLSPGATYHYKVISVDGAGNTALSNEQIFLTPQSSLPDQPAAITNLQVRPGASTRNSVVLEWTATGADRAVGTASGYDLRMSQSKIVEDGVGLNEAEISFSNATSVSNVPVPKIAGTSQSVQISGLETDTVYYFAIRAIDEKGNTSPLSNVINGSAVPPLPVTAVRQGYTMISLPLVPVTSDVQALFGSIVGTPVELFWWNSTGLTPTGGSFVAETQVVPGYGYFLKTAAVNAVLTISGTEVTDPTRSIPLQPGWNMIGNPYPKEIALKNTQVRNITTGEVKTYEEAVIAGWVGNALYHFNGSTYDFASYPEASLKLWHGYWLAVLSETASYELIIPKP